MTAILNYIGKFTPIAIVTINVVSAILASALTVEAQAPAGSQTTGKNTTGAFPIVSQLSNNELFGRATPGAAGIDAARIQLISLLTEGGPPIDRGVIWHIFTPDAAGGSPNLIKQFKVAAPIVELPPGIYMINAAFGLAYLTRRVRVSPGDQKVEKFVINAGGLRVIAKSGLDIFPGSVNASFDLLNDERDQFGNRQKIMSNIRPGRITRLNSGIYQIVSRLGDANAIVASEVTVEAGKLTEATVLHEAAKVTFKLVQSPGGDAVADAKWIVMARPSGKIVKETAGALPSHILVPGDYTIRAGWGGITYTRAFTVRSGQKTEVEVVMR